VASQFPPSCGGSESPSFGVGFRKTRSATIRTTSRRAPWPWRMRRYPGGTVLLWTRKLPPSSGG
jgi:hypothetical protein